MNFGLYLLLNLLLVVLLGIWLRSLIVKRLKPEEILTDLEREVNAMIQDLNGVGDQNVSLLEDRIETLRELLNHADAQIEELESKLRDLENRSIEEPPPAAELQYDDREVDVPVDESPTSSEEFTAVSRENRGTDEDDPIVFPFHRQNPRDTVLRLHSQGVSSDLIASRTGIAIGEVELIISLGSRRIRQ